MNVFATEKRQSCIKSKLYCFFYFHNDVILDDLRVIASTGLCSVVPVKHLGSGRRLVFHPTLLSSLSLLLLFLICKYFLFLFLCPQLVVQTKYIDTLIKLLLTLLTYFRALPLLVCFKTKQRTVGTSLFVK